MNCPSCKSPNPIDARFCGVCGQPVGKAAPAARVAVAPTAAIPTGAGADGAAASAPLAASTSWWSVAWMLARIKNILLTPKTEWPAIAAEPTSIGQLYLGYVMPLTAWAALISVVRLTLIGTRLPFGTIVRTPLSGGLSLVIWTFVGSFVGLFLVGMIVNLLAPTFGGTRDQGQALKVAGYSFTSAYLGSVLALSPIFPGLMQFVVLCFGLYVLYLGLPVLMRAPQSRALGYTATVVICCFVLGIVITILTTGLGIFAGSTGLLGGDTAKAASADQSAAILGNGVGEILGTDAKGKAGITAALSNLIKAGDQNAAASTPTDNGLQNAAPANTPASNPADSAQNAGAAVGGLLGALGGALGGDHPKAAVDFKSLTLLLPPDLPGMKRTAASGESQSAVGIKTTSATGIYQGSTGTIKVEITDMSAVSGLMGMAGALVQDTTSESETGFERDQVIGGRSAHEKYDAPSKHGDITIMVAKRYQVDVSGDGVDMNTLEQAIGRIDLARLEGMKDQGSAPQ